MTTDTMDKKTISTWRFHLQDEIDAAFLYRILAGLINNEKRKKTYLQLAGVEDIRKQYQNQK